MRKIISILTAVGISATGATSAVSCSRYKSTSPVEYKNFSDFSTKNFDKLGEGKTLIFSQALQDDEKANNQAIKAYLEGSEGSGRVKSIIASAFNDYAKAWDSLNVDTMQIQVIDVSKINNPKLPPNYQASFQIYDTVLKRTTETLSLKVVPEKSSLVIDGIEYDASYQIFDPISPTFNLSLTDDINTDDSIFKSTFLTTADLLLDLNPEERMDVVGNGIFEQSYWKATSRAFANKYIGQLKNGWVDQQNKTITFYLPGTDANGKHYRSLEEHLANSPLSTKILTGQVSGVVVSIVLDLIYNNKLTKNNKDQLSAYRINGDTLNPAPNLVIMNSAPTE